MVSRFKKSTGRECPCCGCRDTEEQRQSAGWGRPQSRFVCNHCHHEFSDGWASVEETVENSGFVVYRPHVRCPQCDSRSCPTTSTRWPIRLHSCRGCGNHFQSFDEDGSERDL